MRYWGPVWLWRLVEWKHLSPFCCVDEVDFKTAPQNRREKLLEMAGALRDLRTLLVDGGDRYLPRVARLQSLTTLWIKADGENPLTAAGLSRLHALRYLRVLTIEDAEIGEAELAEIGRFQRLESLALPGWLGPPGCVLDKAAFPRLAS